MTIVLGHGAGADQMSGFMRMVATGLAARGFDAMTFNFLYKEKGKGVPDPKAKLESCYQAVIDAALKHKKLKGNKLVIGGKSMGGRIASQVAAEASGGHRRSGFSRLSAASTGPAGQVTRRTFAGDQSADALCARFAGCLWNRR